MPNKIKVFLVEDSRLVRQSLGSLINHEADIAVCGEADTGGKALEKIRAQKPDIAIIDLGLPDMSGIDLIRRLKEHQPGLLILGISMHDGHAYAENVLGAGAQGFMSKHVSADEVVAAIRKMIDAQTDAG